MEAMSKSVGSPADPGFGEHLDDEPTNRGDGPFSVMEEENPSTPTKPARTLTHAVSRKRLNTIEAGPSIFRKDSNYGSGNGEDPSLLSRFIIFPWSIYYKCWWTVTVICAFLTIFTETYNIAFTPGGATPYNDGSSILEFLLVGVFVIDICITFCLGYYDEQTNELVLSHGQIAKHYFRGMFWLDLVGVFPFYLVALGITGEVGEDSDLSRYLSILRLLRFVRLHRMVLVFEILQYSSKISLMTLTLIRNFCAILVWNHVAACIFYFIARQYDFNPDSTWIGGTMADSELNGFERYLTALYFAIVTFTTVGYGDYSPVNPAEQIWGILFMLINIILSSWIIGSISLLIVKADERTGAYRERVKNLDKFSELHELDSKFRRGLKKQLKLEFNTSEVNEDQILQHFPTAVRRKVLRRIYMPDLLRTNLMRGVRQQFLDSFLAACKVEVIGPGEDLVHRGSIAADLYFLVSGAVKQVADTDSIVDYQAQNERLGAFTSHAGSEAAPSFEHSSRELPEGQFVNEVGFFTESPQMDTVRTQSVCNTLTMSRAAYLIIAADYPDCVTQLLNNLLNKVRSLKRKQSSGLQDGADTECTYTDEAMKEQSHVQKSTVIRALEELIQSHMHKLKDDHTTQFLFAASRGDTTTVLRMCEEGFNPNSSDYDKRTGLMVSSMNGHLDTVVKLLENHADPNSLDMHGSSALYEASTNGHEETVFVLRKHGAKLGMDEGATASKLCQCVFDGDTKMLQRLLQAGADPNAKDYDQRCAAHIAAAEGNLAALKILVEHGASVLEGKDRWSNTVEDEARKSKAAQKLLSYLELLKESD